MTIGAHKIKRNCGDGRRFDREYQSAAVGQQVVEPMTDGYNREFVMGSEQRQTLLCLLKTGPERGCPRQQNKMEENPRSLNLDKYRISFKSYTSEYQNQPSGSTSIGAIASSTVGLSENL
uniref:Uncharacterized protein n=1 Tax=Knipowitschia caucasica TaxID=637954 RepID=A0AAV2LK00_KNICA